MQMMILQDIRDKCATCLHGQKKEATGAPDGYVVVCLGLKGSICALNNKEPFKHWKANQIFIEEEEMTI